MSTAWIFEIIHGLGIMYRRLGDSGMLLHTKRLLNVLGLAVFVIHISACSTPTTTKRYSMSQDSGPLKRPEFLADIKEPIPLDEPLSRAGNRPYTVAGKRYQPIASNLGFYQQGVASWYGRKFHGHQTSNGERYDMYQLSAAHKALPLPSFVRVTHLENGRSVVVRVNDRGPFHSDRIIDLSYAAAYKLGFADQGTALVRIESVPTTGRSVPSQYLQLEAFYSKDNALAFIERVRNLLTGLPVFIQQQHTHQGPIHRVQVGPLSPKQLNQALVKLDQAQFRTPLVLPHKAA